MINSAAAGITCDLLQFPFIFRLFKQCYISSSLCTLWLSRYDLRFVYEIIEVSEPHFLRHSITLLATLIVLMFRLIFLKRMKSLTMLGSESYYINMSITQHLNSLDNETLHICLLSISSHGSYLLTFHLD